MRLSVTLLAGTALAAAAPAYAADKTTDVAKDSTTTAQPVDPNSPPTADAGQAEEIVVTARKREESLQDVPIAVTAVTGETIERRGFTQIKEVAQLTPSLNVNGDSVGRVFVAIRGVGTTLVGTVQPGVGIFVDGIYQPNTAYLNNPLVDVERVEVLRGPQGTLYGKNTLGGAINVITRQPSNRVEGRVGGSYAGPDNAWDAFGSISGPIIEDKLQVRVAASHREQEGFIRNTLLGTDANPLNMDSVNGTIRALPAPDVVLTVNGYHDWVKGGNIPYSHITGPTDYSREVAFNATDYITFRYKGLNAKLQAPIGADTKVTLIGAYDQRDGKTPDLDVDFNAVDILRQRSVEKLKTTSAELRFDSNWSDQISTLFGLYYSHETNRAEATTLAAGLIASSTSDKRRGDTYAAFGNIFWRPMQDLEVAAGLRYDHEKRTAGGAVSAPALVGPTTIADAPAQPLIIDLAEAKIKSTNLLPKLTVTKHWSRDLMTYGSIARGFRGGGFNAVTAPFRTYKGDSAWTYELGTKYSMGRRASVAAAIFYNDYQDYIGLNQFVLGTNGAPVTVDLNTGDVKSYGAEIEGTFRPTSNWTLTGGASYVHARVKDSSIYTERTGLELGSNRLPFQPDWTFNLGSNYVVPVGGGDLDFFTGVVAKGNRIGASLSETRVPVLKGYALVNASLTYRISGFEVGAFVNNAFNKKYMDSFIEQTTLANAFCPGGLAGCPNAPLVSDLGITGEGRRYGVRTRFRF
jgi:iron complex outermembrane receptor protein